MATINLGNLTFTHKGDYAGGTAYVKNDIVYYATNGNSYIAKGATTGNAPTSTAHWDLFVAGASGIWNAGLSLGSAGEAVKVNSAGNALEFGSVAGGKVLQVQNFLLNHGSSATTTSTSFQDSSLTDQITPSATSSKILVMVHLNGHRSQGSNGNAIITVKRAISGGASTDIGGNQTYRLAHTYVTSAQMTAFFVYDSPNTTSAIDYTVQWRTDNSSAAAEIFRHTGASTITLMEIGA